jgi:hypothetical protein
MEKKCEGCGKEIGFVPASAKIFRIRQVGSERDADLCLKCITFGIEQATEQMKNGAGE